MPRVSRKARDIQKVWEDKISRAKKVKKNWSDKFQVELAREYFDGVQSDPGYAKDDWITVNNIYSHIKAQLPALYAADPYFYVTLSRCFKPDPQIIALYEAKGKIRGAMLNYLKTELKLKSKMRMSIQDAMFSFGVAKMRYVADIKANEKAGQPITSEETGDPLTGDTGEPLLEPETLPVGGHYEVSRIHPDDILVDEDAGPLEDSWNWIAHRIKMTFDEAKKHPHYSNAALRFLKNKGAAKDEAEQRREDRKKGSDVRGRSETESRVQSQKEPDLLIFWEVYLPKKKTWLTIAEHGEVPVAEEGPYPPGVEDHPFAFLRFTLRDDSPYPLPPASPMIDLSKEYNRARSDIQKHRKRFNRKYVASKQMFGDDITEISKVEHGDDGTIVMANGLDVRGAVVPIQDAQQDPMRYQELAYLKAEMVEIMGNNNSESLGIASANTATQTAVLDKRLEVKEGDAMSMVIDFATDVARKLDMLVQTHMDEDQAVKISGPQGEMWQVVKPADYEEIEGEYQYTVNVGATLPRMPHIERASWQAFLGLLATFPHLATSRRLMQKMAEMHHIEDDAMVDELHQIATAILSGQSPMPGQSGSQPGTPEERPVSAMGGAQGGVKSLTQGSAALGV
jgi:hypothetical protein